MIVNNIIAPRIEARILNRLRDAVRQIAPDDMQSLLADGLFDSHCCSRAQDILARYGFIILGEVDDGIEMRYIDGLLIGPISEPFDLHFMSQQVHFHLKATVHRNGNAEKIGFNTRDVLQVPLLHVLGAAELADLEPAVERALMVRPPLNV